MSNTLRWQTHASGNHQPSTLMANEVKFVKDKAGKLVITLLSSCYADRTEEERWPKGIIDTLKQYPRELLVVEEWKTKDEVIVQCLEILKSINNTMICADFLGSKIQKPLIIDPSNVNVDWQRISIFNNEQLIELYELSQKYSCKFYIHLPNWILEVSLMKWTADWQIVVRAKKFLANCVRAKRTELRVTLSSDKDIQEFIKLKWKYEGGHKIKIVCWDRTLVWLVTDISRNWICFYTSPFPEDFKGKDKFVELSFLWKKLKIAIRQIANGHWFCRIWAKFIFDNNEDEKEIWVFLEELNNGIKQNLTNFREVMGTKYIDNK